MMKKFLLLIVLFILIIGAFYIINMQNKKPEITPGHILQIKITADGLFWNELLPNAAENFRQKRTIYAVNIDPTQYSPLPSVKQYQIGGKALIWIANMKDDIALEKSYFSDLSLADATRIKKGQRKVVGKYNPRVGSNLD